MASAFGNYQQALKKFSEKIREISEEINNNRIHYQAATKQYEDAFLADDDATAQEWEGELAGLNAEFEILNRKADALNSASGKGSNSFVRDAAKAVIVENRKAIEALRKTWDEKKSVLLTLQKQYLEILVDLGKLSRESGFLREQCTLASTDAGSNLFVSSLSDELDVSRKKGFLWLEDQHIRLAFTSGEMPRDETFAGTITGTPKAKIRTDDAEQAPPREYKAKPRPVAKEAIATE
jgi:hypothetical protein